MLRTYVRTKSAVLRTVRSAIVCDDQAMPTTVLIVDDHPSFRASARAVLEAHGFEIVGEAEDGAAALVAVAELAPDVVLLDIQLPDMTGFDVCEALESRNGSGPAVVLVSSRDVTDYGDLIGESHARGFVPKAELSGEAVAALVR
jgi:DNA-binding NarL/FixJ family response regulator